MMITRHRTGAQLFLALQSLALWSVLAPGQGIAQVGEGAGPERGVAVISPDTVRVGETITIDEPEVTFRVLEITKTTIELVATDPEFDLTVNVQLTLRR